MRRAKDKQQVPKRYYRPEQVSCPRCGQVLRRCYAVGRKYIVFLSGRYLVVSRGYRCPNPTCAGRDRVYGSQAARGVTVRGSSFALAVIVQIGYGRFWRRGTVAQIHAVLTQERHLPISERAVLYLIGVFLVLLRCPYHLRRQAHTADFRRQGLFLAIDALKPEKGNPALYGVRELKCGLVLQVVPLLAADPLTLAERVLKPITALGYRNRGVVSDDEKALQIAGAQVFPGVAHQTCQGHCLREAAAPVTDADQVFTKALKRAIRGPLYAAQRALHRLAADDPRQVVLSPYADLIRSTLTEGSKPPFALGGLRVVEDLARLEASLRRSRKKGASRSWSSCWPWCNTAKGLRLSTGHSKANAVGWSSWRDDLTPQTTRVSRAQPLVASNSRSKTFWSNWSSLPKVIPTMRRWVPLSAPPSVTAGRASSPVTLGPNATAPTMIWRPSSAACGLVNGKSMVASPCLSSSSALANGPSSSTQRKPSSKCCSACSSSTQPNLIGRTLAFYKYSVGSKRFIASATGLGAASRNWSNNGLRPSGASLTKIPCRRVLRLLFVLAGRISKRRILPSPAQVN